MIVIFVGVVESWCFSWTMYCSQNKRFTVGYYCRLENGKTIERGFFVYVYCSRGYVRAFSKLFFRFLHIQDG